MATERARTWLSWSSGKDSAFALHVLRQGTSVDVVGLVVTLNADADRVAMHAVRRALVEAQAERVGLPLHIVNIPSPCPNDVYQARMAAALAVAAESGVTNVAFGDLFLADIRAYREQSLAGSGITPLFPLWGLPTDTLAREMLRAGTRAVVTCVDPQQLDPAFVGRQFDEQFLADLPTSVDPCGERGEFHTFVSDSPVFRDPIDVAVGDVTERDGFAFCDVVPSAPPAVRR